MPRNGSSTGRLRFSLSRGGSEERCPPEAATSNGRVKWGLPIDRRQYSAHAALAIDARGIRVSTKYLIEKQRYEGGAKLNPVTFYDDQGNPHTYGICNTITPLLARWLLERHPEMNIWTKHSLFDEMENNHEA